SNAPATRQTPLMLQRPSARSRPNPGPLLARIVPLAGRHQRGQPTHYGLAARRALLHQPLRRPSQSAASTPPRTPSQHPAVRGLPAIARRVPATRLPAPPHHRATPAKPRGSAGASEALLQKPPPDRPSL